MLMFLCEIHFLNFILELYEGLSWYIKSKSDWREGTHPLAVNMMMQYFRRRWQNMYRQTSLLLIKRVHLFNIQCKIFKVYASPPMKTYIHTPLLLRGMNLLQIGCDVRMLGHARPSGRIAHKVHVTVAERRPS